MLDFLGEPMVQRITIYQKLRLPASERQPEVAWRVLALSDRDEILAETTFRPEAEPMASRFEWELPVPLPVAKLIIALAGENPIKETEFESTPFAVEAWGPKDRQTSLTPRAALAGSSLAASRSGPTDEDGNGLEDAWEARFPLPRSAGPGILAAEDPDGDGLLNQMEGLAGRDPSVPDQVGSRLTAEYWRNLRATDVPGLTSMDAFYRQPDIRVVRWMDRYAPLPTNTGLRLRGYLTAPETGEYTFWIAARNAGQLWISEDDSKFRKYKIAELSPALGTAHGVSRMALDQWDQFGTQRSRPIRLEAGKTYFLEALAQQGGESEVGQLTLAWMPPGKERRVLEGRMLQTYIPVPADVRQAKLGISGLVKVRASRLPWAEVRREQDLVSQLYRVLQLCRK